MKHAREGRPIPEGWTLGPDGKPTTDPETGLAGSMVPAGGYKGVGIGLIVEVLAAALSGATLGKDASPFSGTKGGPPATGQGFIVIDPAAPSGGAFADRINALVAAMRDQPGVHIPGDRRLAARTRAAIDGVAVSAATLARVRALT
jgi:(2R)-3-sulfolactate dehydrogenase (NADP+)